MVELRATHEPVALRDVLETVAASFDAPAQPPQPVPTTMSFQYGESGVHTDVEASMGDVVAAFYRPTAREAHLTLSPVQAERPDINLLLRLISNHLDDRAFGGVASIFILDLESGREILIDSGMPMTGMEYWKCASVGVASRPQVWTKPPLNAKRYTTSVKSSHGTAMHIAARRSPSGSGIGTPESPLPETVV